MSETVRLKPTGERYAKVMRSIERDVAELLDAVYASPDPPAEVIATPAQRDAYRTLVPLAIVALMLEADAQ